MFQKIIGLLCLVCVGFGVVSSSALAGDTGSDAAYTQWKGGKLYITLDQPVYPAVEVNLYALAGNSRPASAAPLRPLRFVHVDIDRWDDKIVVAAHAHRVPAELIKAVMLRESGMNPNAASCCAAGLMQFIPSTARAMGVRDRLDPEQSINGGAKYLRLLIDAFAGHPNSLSLAIAAYNAGPQAVRDAGYKVPCLSETRAYVPNVLQAYRVFLTQRPVLGAEDLRPHLGDPLYPN